MRPAGQGPLWELGVASERKKVKHGLHREPHRSVCRAKSELGVGRTTPRFFLRVKAIGLCLRPFFEGVWYFSRAQGGRGGRCPLSLP